MILKITVVKVYLPFPHLLLIIYIRDLVSKAGATNFTNWFSISVHDELFVENTEDWYKQIHLADKQLLCINIEDVSMFPPRKRIKHAIWPNVCMWL